MHSGVRQKDLEPVPPISANKARQLAQPATPLYRQRGRAAGRTSGLQHKQLRPTQPTLRACSPGWAARQTF